MQLKLQLALLALVNVYSLRHIVIVVVVIIIINSASMSVIIDLKVGLEGLETVQWRQHYIHMYVINYDTLSSYTAKPSLLLAESCIKWDQL